MYYPGNKNIPGLIHKIVNQIPVCTDFYELFAGSSAVSKYLSVLPAISVRYHLNDIDPYVTANNDYPSGSVITNLPAVDLIQSLKTVPSATGIFVFMDPPYSFDTRPLNTNLYNFEMSYQDHVELLLSVQDLNHNCMIIHPANDLYNHYLRTWRTVQVKIRYHNKTSIENLYMNYLDPLQLLTFHLYGTNCWDRQRIKRKGDRLIHKLLSLPIQERNYIINRIQSITTLNQHLQLSGE